MIKEIENVKLEDLLTDNLVESKVQLKDRNEVIERIGQLMYNAGKIKKKYIKAMSNVIEALGPYCVIAPGIALLHARPEDGVVDPCLALITLTTPIAFNHPENDPVDLVFGLAALDDQTHVQALTFLAKRLATCGIIEKLRESRSKEELIQTILVG